MPTESSSSTPPASSAPPQDDSGRFLTTRWTQVSRASGNSPEAQVALSELCDRYWHPVHRFILRERHDPEVARELTQEFFARLLAGSGVTGASPRHGRFRTYLLGAVKHFLADERDRALAAKRGHGLVPASLSTHPTETSAGLQVADPSASPDDARFDREWALLLLDRAYTAIASEWAGAGRAQDFQILKPWLIGDSDSLSQADAARQLGMREGAVKVAIHRLRKRLRQLVRDDIAQTVSSATEVDDELRYFVRILSSNLHG